MAVVGVPGVVAAPYPVRCRILVGDAGSGSYTQVAHQCAAEALRLSTDMGDTPSDRAQRLVRSGFGCGTLNRAFGVVAEIQLGRLLGLDAPRPPGRVRQSPDRSASVTRLPECIAQRDYVVLRNRTTESVGGSILKVVGLVKDQPFGMLNPLVIGDDQGVVEHRHMRMAVPELVVGPAVEIKAVKVGDGRPERILDAQDPAQAVERYAATVQGTGAQVVPVAGRGLCNPAAHHRQGECLIRAEAVGVLGQSVELAC